MRAVAFLTAVVMPISAIVGHLNAQNAVGHLNAQNASSSPVASSRAPKVAALSTAEHF